jgi:hypothetical protein
LEKSTRPGRITELGRKISHVEKVEKINGITGYNRIKNKMKKTKVNKNLSCQSCNPVQKRKI